MEMEVGSFEAKNRLSELLALAEKGQCIYITRRGRRVAMLVSATEFGRRKLEGQSLVSAIRAFRAKGRSGPEPLSELVREGRRV